MVPLRYVRWPELRQRLGLSKSTVWRMEKAGCFPRRVRLAKNAVGWAEPELEQWLRERPSVYLGSVGLIRTEDL